MWDPEKLWLKAKLYIDKANGVEQTSSEFPFWSALSLELLARAALTYVHPVLNADPQEDGNILYACGFQIKGQPRSVPAHAVYLRLEKVVPNFLKPHREFCDYMAFLRNQEIHTAELAFEPLMASKWLSKFYEVARILCEFLGRNLVDYLGKEVGESAEQLVAALNREEESKVKSKIAAHARVFRDKSPKEQRQLMQQAKLQTEDFDIGDMRHKCPACDGDALLEGGWIRDSKPFFKDDELLVERVFLAAKLKCGACGLNLTNVNEIYIAGIEPRFSQYVATDLHEVFQPEYVDEYMNM